MMDIDLVYLWVNGNDPEWIKKHDACVGKMTVSDVNCKGRYVDNDELKYSLRSIEKYAPWIHRIFIVTDNQIPEWLDCAHPKIRIVDHSEILPEEARPCFNANILEHHLHRIPGLSEHFLFANDDMYLNKPVTPGTFFAGDSMPIIRMNRRPFRKWGILYRTKVRKKTLGNYKQIIHNAAMLVERKYGRYYSGKGHHNIDAYLKSSYQHTRQLFDKEINSTLTNHVRAANDIQRNLYSYVALEEKQGHLQYVSQHTSFRLHIDNRKQYEKLRRYNPTFFCLNDSEYANDEDRIRAKAFIANLFPDKSRFEKG